MEEDQSKISTQPEEPAASPEITVEEKSQGERELVVEKANIEVVRDLPTMVSSEPSELIPEKIIPENVDKNFGVEISVASPVISEVVENGDADKDGNKNEPIVCPDIDSPFVPFPKKKQLPKEPEAVDSPKEPVPHIHIAKIKERLFERIKSPAKPSARRSVRLGTRGKSPARMLNTPERLNSPAFKRKVVCAIYDDVTVTPKQQEPSKLVPEHKDIVHNNGADEETKPKGPKIFKVNCSLYK